MASIAWAPKYEDTIISRGSTFLNTLPHEIAHVLTDGGIPHPDGNVGLNKVNILAVPAQDVISLTTGDGDVTDSRRITAAQIRDMYRKRPNLLLKPGS